MTRRPITEKDLKPITETIVREFGPEKIILFGSLAQGKPRPESDIDLLIIKKSRLRPLERERVLRRKLFGHRFPPMDLLIYTPAELEKRKKIRDFFISEVLSEGKVLYVKE